MFNRPISLLTLLTACSACWGQAPSFCPPLLAAQKAQLVTYVVKRYSVPSTVTIDIVESSPTTGCYSKIVFGGKGPVGPVSLALYLSPDHRYLTPDLFDTALDPDEDLRTKARQNLEKLTEGEFASRGQADAPVVVVEFSDFQCPYCKVAAQKLEQEPLMQDGKNVRIVYRHLPLSQHDWAQKGAQAAACAQFQNQTAFWKMHDALFSQQSDLTNANAAPKISEIAAKIPDLDQGKFRECVDRDMSLGTVTRDKRLAEQLQVGGTPTIFVNGRIIEPSALHAAIVEELRKQKLPIH